eukprot:1290566-Alexandrium_andersonii.AAC.1
MSAGFFPPGHFSKAKSPERTRSCTHSWPTARCRTRPMPARRRIPMAALLSAQTSREAENPRSWAMAAKPNPPTAPLKIPASSASPELRAIVF